MREPYGILSSRFWDGPTGLALQRAGPDAVILATFLTSNRWANMIGLYELPLDAIVASLPVITGRTPRDDRKRASVRHALASVRHAVTTEGASQAAFCHYDEATGVVWVTEMARFRLGLDVTGGLSEKDKRVVGANKLYARIKPNPFLGPFYDRYARDLHLTIRRDAQTGTTQAPPMVPSKALIKGHRAPSEPLGKPVISSTEISTTEKIRTAPLDAELPAHPVENSFEPPAQEPVDPKGLLVEEPVQTRRRSDYRAGRHGQHPASREPAEDGNYRVIAKIVAVHIDAIGVEDEVELKERTKEDCARRAIAYDSDVVARAIAGEVSKVKLGLRTVPAS